MAGEHLASSIAQGFAFFLFTVISGCSHRCEAIHISQDADSPWLLSFG